MTMLSDETEHDHSVTQNQRASAEQIRDMFGMYQMDPDWTLPSKIGDNMLAWMIQVNGFAIDARNAPREIQEEAFRKGLIPYIPENKA
jgi:hypothetical protein